MTETATEPVCGKTIRENEFSAHRVTLSLCARKPDHRGECANAAVIAKYPECPHGWLGPCQECEHPTPEAAPGGSVETMPGQIDTFAAMHARSGQFETRDRLVVVLFRLLRDGHLAPGALEAEVDAVVLAAKDEKPGDGDTLYQIDNGWMARYAEDLARRIVTGKESAE